MEKSLGKNETATRLDSSAVDGIEGVWENTGMKTVKLNKVEWGQVLDGLTCRVALYEETVVYYEYGVSYGCIAEVRDADEARTILDYYRSIIGKIEKQLGKGGYVQTAEDLRRNIS